MEEHKIERLFKAEKEGEAMDPPAFVWHNLESDLKKQTKKRTLFYFWMLGLVIGCGLLGIVYIQSGEDVPSRAISNNSTLAVNSHEASVHSASGQLTTTQVQVQAAVTEPDFPTLQENATGEKHNAKNQATKRTTSSTATRVDNSTGTNQVKPFVTTIQTPQQQRIKDAALNPSTLEHSPTSISPLDRRSHVGNHLSQPAPGTQSKSQPLQQIPTVEQSFIVSTILSPLLSVKNSVDLPSSNPIIPSHVAQRKNIIGGHISLGKPTFNSRTMHDFTTDGSYDWYDYGAGIVYERLVTSRMSIGTGLSYRVSKRKLDYKSTDLILLQTSAGSFEYGKLISTGEQRYSFINIPLSIKYQLLTEKVRLAVGFSGILNVELTTAGKSIDAYGQVQRYSSADNQYQSSLGLGYAPFLSIDFPIREHMSISLRPHYVVFINPLKESDSNLLTDYSSFGIDIGLNRRF